jgi:peptide/nickel transport system permease protein
MGHMALLIREAEVNELITMCEAADAVEEGFRQLGAGRAFNNPRSRVKLGGEIMHVLPAALPEMDALGLKSYTAFRGGIRFLVLLFSALTQGPSLSHSLGTDDLGRDVLSRLIFGARVSLQVGIIAVGIAVTFSVTLGLLSGYVGGFTEEAVMRFVDAVQASPRLVLALAITAALGPGIANAMIAIGFIAFPTTARLTRGKTLSVRESEYVTASKVIGLRPTRIMLRHILPNVTAPIIVQATLLVATAIVTEALLSFLGVGVQPPTPTWGGTLRTGSQYLETAAWIAFSAGTAIFLTVLSFNLVGDKLRAALDHGCAVAAEIDQREPVL